MPVRLVNIRRFACAASLAWAIGSTVGCAPMSGWVMNSSGAAYYQRGEFEMARNEFARAVYDDPLNPDYRFNLAVAQSRLGQVAEAEQILQHNLTIDPSHEPTYAALSRLMIDTGRSSEAVGVMQTWVGSQPYNPDAYVGLASAQQKTGDLSAAQQTLQQALRVQPNEPKVLAQLGEIHQAQGNVAMASQMYQQSLAANVHQPDVQAKLMATANQAHPGSMPAAQLAQSMPKVPSVLHPIASGQKTPVSPTAAPTSIARRAPQNAHQAVQQHAQNQPAINQVAQHRPTLQPIPARQPTPIAASPAVNTPAPFAMANQVSAMPQGNVVQWQAPAQVPGYRYVILPQPVAFMVPQGQVPQQQVPQQYQVSYQPVMSQPAGIQPAMLPQAVVTQAQPVQTQPMQVVYQWPQSYGVPANGMTAMVIPQASQPQTTYGAQAMMAPATQNHATTFTPPLYQQQPAAVRSPMVSSVPSPGTSETIFPVSYHPLPMTSATSRKDASPVETSAAAQVPAFTPPPQEPTVVSASHTTTAPATTSNRNGTPIQVLSTPTETLVLPGVIQQPSTPATNLETSATNMHVPPAPTRTGQPAVVAPSTSLVSQTTTELPPGF